MSSRLHSRGRWSPPSESYGFWRTVEWDLWSRVEDNRVWRVLMVMTVGGDAENYQVYGTLDSFTETTHIAGWILGSLAETIHFKAGCYLDSLLKQINLKQDVILTVLLWPSTIKQNGILTVFLRPPTHNKMHSWRSCWDHPHYTRIHSLWSCWDYLLTAFLNRNNWYSLTYRMRVFSPITYHPYRRLSFLFLHALLKWSI